MARSKVAKFWNCLQLLETLPTHLAKNLSCEHSTSLIVYVRNSRKSDGWVKKNGKLLELVEFLELNGKQIIRSQ